MTTKEMADLITDALLTAELITTDNLAKVAEVVEEEIRVRLALNDPITLDE